MVFEKAPLNRRLSLHRDYTVVCVQMQTGLVFCPGPKKMTNVANNKHNALFDQTQRKTRIKFPQGVNKKAMQKNPAISRREQPRLHTS